MSHQPEQSSSLKDVPLRKQTLSYKKRRTSNICGNIVGEKIKRHTLAKHLPWYLNPAKACWECEVYVRDLEDHKQACSPYFHFRPQFDNSKLPYWCQLMHGLLIFLKNKFALSTIQDLHKFVVDNGLFPPPVVAETGNFDPCHVELLKEMNISLGIPSVIAVFDISPPNYAVCLLHWKILSKLVILLDQEARDGLKSMSFPVPFAPQLQLGFDVTGSFIDSHCHLDKIFRDSGFKTFVDYLESCQYKMPNLQFCVSNFVYPNLWRSCSALQGASDMIKCTIGVHPHFIETCRVQ